MNKSSNKQFFQVRFGEAFAQIMDATMMGAMMMVPCMACMYAYIPESKSCCCT